MESNLEIIKESAQIMIREISNQDSISFESVFDIHNAIINGFYQMIFINIREKYTFLDFENDLKKYFETVELTNSIAESFELENWLESSKLNYDEIRYRAYQKLLILEGKGDIINQLNADTFKILDSCHDPKKLNSKWDRRGLVYGHVQSGKTANYIGLINRAIDAGYQIIIVLTGMTEDLRKQTQARIDSGVIGKSFGVKSGIGMHTQNLEEIFSATSIKFDLKKADDWQYNNIDLNKKQIWVIKKNKVVLENLIMWLDHQRKIQNQEVISGIPFLIIDDEADNASIQSLSKADYDLWETGQDLSNINLDDLSEEQEVLLNSAKDVILKTINRNIRVALSLIGNKTFVAYTATPYSIINQSVEDLERKVQIRGKDFKIDSNNDLFPEHFIIPIKPGRTYFGIDRIFNDDYKKRLPVLKNITNLYSDEILDIIFNYRRNEIYSFKDIPRSLEDAILYFILSIIIRKHRGHKDYNTLLIHTTHLTKKVDYLSVKVTEFIKKLKSSLMIEDIYMDRIQFIFNDIKQNSKNNLFNDYFDSNERVFPENITKNEIIDIIQSKDVPFEIISYHSSKEDSLEHHNHDLKYEEKSLDRKLKNYIVIGGNRLSRGLTLEGLTTSYFTRNSTRQDSLYQMGRWFGYRTNYEDLVRIFLPIEQIEWFESIYKIEQNLRTDFEANNSDDSKVIPRDAIIKLAVYTLEKKYDYSTSVNDFEKKYKAIPSICDPNKLRKTTTELMSFYGVTKTKKILKDIIVQQKNLKLVCEFIQLLINNNIVLFDNKLIPNEIKNENYNFQNVKSNLIVEFLLKYNYHPDLNSEFRTLCNFIIENEHELPNWSVVLAQKNLNEKDGEYSQFELKFNDINTKKIKLIQRAWDSEEENSLHFSSFLDKDVDHTFDIINNENLNEYINNRSSDNRTRLRNESKKPILIIYPSKNKYDKSISEYSLIYIIIPVTQNSKKVKYIVRNRYV